MGVAGPSQATDARFATVTGEWRGDAVSIRWRETRRTVYRPETVIWIENVASLPVAVIFEWTTRACKERTIDLDLPSRSFAHRLFSDLAIDSTLKPGEWDSFLFPRGLPPDQPLSAGEECHARIALRALSGDRIVDRVELELPAPLPPPKEHE
jgi:hypothetical protein